MVLSQEVAARALFVPDKTIREHKERRFLVSPSFTTDLFKQQGERGKGIHVVGSGREKGVSALGVEVEPKQLSGQ